MVNVPGVEILDRLANDFRHSCELCIEKSVKRAAFHSHSKIRKWMRIGVGKSHSK